MPKIKNWSRDDAGLPQWRHDELDHITVAISPGTDPQTGRPSQSKQKRTYTIDAFNHAHHTNLDFGLTSLEEARKRAVEILREHPDGKVCPTIQYAQNRVGEDQKWELNDDYYETEDNPE